MAETVRGMVFEIGVDSRTAEAKLKQFRSTAQTTVGSVGTSSSKAERELRVLEGGLSRTNTAARRASTGVSKAAASSAELADNARVAATASTSLGGAFTALRSTILPLIAAFGAFTIASRAIALINSQIGAAIRDAQGYEAAVTALNVALLNTGRATSESRAELLAFAKAQTEASQATENQIIQAIAQAKTLGATNEQTKKIIRAATDYGVVTGNTDQALRQTIKTLGGYAGELGEIFPELKELTREQLRAGAAADVLASKLAGAGISGAATFEGSLNNLNSSMVQLRAEIAGPLIQVLAAFLNQAVIPFIKDATSAARASATLRNTIFDLGLAVAALGELLSETAGVVANHPLFQIARAVAIADLTQKLNDAKTATALLTIAIDDGKGPQTAMGQRFRGLAETIKAMQDQAGETVEDPFQNINAGLDTITAKADIALARIESIAEPSLLSGKQEQPFLTGEIAPLPVQPAVELEQRYALEQQAQDDLLALRIQYAQQWSETQEQLQLTQLDNEYMRMIDQANRLGADTAALEEAWQLERTAIADRNATQREQRAKREAATRKQAVLQLADASLKVATAAFGQHKAIAYAEAVVNTARAVVNALATPAPWPIPAIFAAAAAAAGLAQVATISSANIGGGGGVSVPSAGVSSAASVPAAGDVGGFSPNEVPPGQQIVFIIEGESYIQNPDEFFQDAVNRIKQLQERTGA